MPKKCIICSEEAKFKIKDTSDYYCQECAEENFSDLSVLVKVEEEAQRLKKFLLEKIDLGRLNEEAEVGEEKEKVPVVEEDDDDEESKQEEE
ncbi:MAG: hypothetical protein ABIG93_03215 [archaeon]